jgi:hypothetical protein
MAMGPQVAKPQPTVIITAVMRAKVLRGVHRTRSSVRRCGSSAWPGNMQHDEEPHECQQGELVEKRCETMALPPLKCGEMGALYPVVRAE